MEIESAKTYMFSRNGQNYGPFVGTQLVKLAQSSQVLPDDHIWTEGMKDWKPATSFSQLAAVFSPAQNETPEAVVESAAPAVFEDKPATDEMTPFAEEKSTRSPVKCGTVQRSDYAPRPGASFGWVVISFILFLFGLIAYMAAGAYYVISLEEGAEIGTGNPIVFLGLGAVVGITFLLILIFTLKYLYRAWAYIQDLPNVTTTPGKAVGFLFIPFFNVVWPFFAFYRWAQDFNTRCDYSDPVSSPRVTEGLFLAIASCLW